MSNLLPLLSTRLNIPKPQQNLINRQQLKDKIIKGLSGKFTLVSAPAGFGKTTVLTEIINQGFIPAAWLSLEKNDNDYHLFLSYVTGALSRIRPGFGELTMAMLNSPRTTEALMNTFINEVSSTLPASVLILDDYHNISSEKIHNAVSYFLEHFPQNLHLIIVSRTDPPFSLGRLRVAGQVNEIRSEDLKFNFSETRQFFNQLPGLKLNDPDVEKLAAKTEGWIAGIQLAGLAIKGNIDRNKFISEFTGNNQLIAEYLTDEVLQQLPAEEKDFLLKTSVLDKLNFSLCNAVTGRENCKEILEHVKNSNLFLIPLDDNGQWYRYHKLFRELLLERLSQLFPGESKELHLKAGSWYEQHQLTEAALTHYFAAGAPEIAAKIIDSEGIKMLLRGEISLLKSWIDLLPVNIISKFPVLCISTGWINCLTNQLDKVDIFIDFAEKCSESEKTSPVFLAEIRFHIDLLKAYYYSLYYKGDTKYFKYCIDLLLKAKQAIPADNLIFISSTDRLLGGLYTAINDWDSALQFFRAGRSAGEQANNQLARFSSGGSCALVLIARGKLREAFNLCSREEASLPAFIDKINFQPLAFIYLPLAKIKLEWNDSEEACGDLQFSLDFASQMDNKYLIISASLELAMVNLRQGLKNEAELLLLKVEKIQQQNPVFLDILTETNLIKLWMALNRQSEIIAWEENYRKEREIILGHNSPDLPLWKEINLARVLLSRQQTSEALLILEDLNLPEQTSDNQVYIVEALVFTAAAFKLAGKHDRSLEFLERALTIAEPENYLRTFADEGLILSGLLLEILQRQKVAAFSSAYVIRILEIINKEIKSPAQPLLEPLSERELEILRFLAAGSSNQVIADKLFLAVGTIKKHTNTIYSKLNVSSRTQAVQKARELEII